MFSCTDDSLKNEPAKSNFREKQEDVIVARALTDVEQAFKDKIMRLAGDEFRNELNTMTDKELENLAVSFLLPESNRILLENGYTEERIKSDFEDDNLKLVQAALALYAEKTKTNH